MWSTDYMNGFIIGLTAFSNNFNQSEVTTDTGIYTSAPVVSVEINPTYTPDLTITAPTVSVSTSVA